MNRDGMDKKRDESAPKFGSVIKLNDLCVVVGSDLRAMYFHGFDSCAAMLQGEMDAKDQRIKELEAELEKAYEEIERLDFEDV